MVDQGQMQTVLNYIDTGVDEGAALVTGGRRARQDSGGFYVEPTVFVDVRNDMKIAREEIFGPVVGAITFAGVDQAIEIANDTSYGLRAPVWTRDITTAHRLARALRVGMLTVTSYGEGDICMPFGGYKESGLGRDKSLHTFENYTQLKTTLVNLKS